MNRTTGRGVVALGTAGLAVLLLVILVYFGQEADHGKPGPRNREVAREANQSGPAEAMPDVPGDDVVPHPYFPTARRAGTAGLFRLEEPDRGPDVPELKLPSTRDGRLSWRLHCEVDPVGLVCGPESSKADPGWRVHRSPTRTIAELWQGGRAHRTLVEERRAPGKPPFRLARFDGHGELEWLRSYDPPGQRYTARRRNGANQLDGCGYMALSREDDADVVVCLQWLLKPMLDSKGVAVRRLLRDAAGFVREERRQGRDRQPLAGHDGVQRVTYQRDGAGRELRRLNHDLQGKPVLSTESGCHGKQTLRDGRGRAVEVRCLGLDGKPAPDSKEVAITRYEYDERGCRSTEVHLDAAGRPTAGVDGVQRIQHRRDALCEEEQRSCHREGRVSCGPGQPAEFRFALDGLGRVSRARHYNAARGPGQDPEYGVFELRYTYDRLGNRSSEACFDAAGQAVLCGNTGFHRAEGRYDGAGRKVEDRFFDVKGRPTTNLGTFVRRFRYDAYDHLRETRDFDESGKPVESLGSASRRYLYDEGHQLFGLLLFDREGRPAAFSGCITGHACPLRDWHAMRVVRSPKGRAVANLFFDGDRRLIHRNDCSLVQCWK